MKRPEISKECVKPLLDTKYIKVADLQYQEGCHYFDASRRSFDDLIATKSSEELLRSCADAVSCIIILEAPGQEPRLLLAYEYRYPAGQFLLGPCAGLIDAGDKENKTPGEAAVSAAIREIEEETGLKTGAADKIRLISPLMFSTPGMTDECNALVCAVLHVEDYSGISQAGAEGTECFNGYELLTKKEAEEFLEKGKDRFGVYYSIYTYAILLYFVTDQWKK